MQVEVELAFPCTSATSAQPSTSWMTLTALSPARLSLYLPLGVCSINGASERRWKLSLPVSTLSRFSRSVKDDSPLLLRSSSISLRRDEKAPKVLSKRFLDLLPCFKTKRLQLLGMMRFWHIAHNHGFLPYKSNSKNSINSKETYLNSENNLLCYDMSSADVAVQVFRELENEDFRVLHIIEAAMAKREFVPVEQIQKFSKLPMDRIHSPWANSTNSA